MSALRLLAPLLLLAAMAWLDSPAPSGKLKLGGVGGSDAMAEEPASFRRFDRAERGGLQLVTPEEGSPRAKSIHDTITVTKSSRPPMLRARRSQGSWRYLSASVREAIDRALPGPRAWREITLHASGSRTGNAEVLDVAHRRQRGMTGGLAYHFVIGNGAYSPAGKIEVGPRWAPGLPSQALPKPRDEQSIAVAFIGDFTAGLPSQAQVDALVELTAYLRSKLGAIPLVAHREADSSAPGCPGPMISSVLLEQISEAAK